ncbi:MAG: ABC transporter ATP-binding protein [Candidatus Berkelbacteria bacterium]
MIKLTNISKIYHSGDVETIALDSANLEIKDGEFVAIMGPSGSGKSTMMHILGLLDVPTKGSYIFDGHEVSQFSENELAKIRNKKIGFVFQFFNLLPRTSALKNVMLPMLYAGVPLEEKIKKAIELLKIVELGDRLDHTPSQLSGGQQQRVAVARALAMDPPVIMADEPTGNLATTQSEEIMHIFRSLNKQGKTIIMITHEPTVAAYAKRIVVLKDGKIISDKPNTGQRHV